MHSQTRLATQWEMGVRLAIQPFHKARVDFGFCHSIGWLFGFFFMAGTLALRPLLSRHLSKANSHGLSIRSSSGADIPITTTELGVSKMEK
jgi:hypothetical protein